MTVNLVKFAREHDLFFPQLYEMWFLTKTSQFFNKAQIFCTKNEYSLFGIDIKKASQVYINLFDSSFEDLIINFKQPKSSTVDTKSYQKYLSDIFDTGVFFDKSIFDNVEFSRYFSISNLKKFKELNKEKEVQFYENNLPEKISTSPKVKI